MNRREAVALLGYYSLVMVVVVVAINQPGCLTYGPAVRGELKWSDYHETRDAIRCALASRLHPEEVEEAVEFTVSAVDPGKIPKFNCITFFRERNIAVRWDYRSLRSSCYRHEIFAHVAPWLSTGDRNQDHKATWEPLELELEKAFQRCL